MVERESFAETRKQCLAKAEALIPDQLPAFVGLSLLLAITPGPDVLYVLSRSLAEGRQAGLVAAAGFALGNIVHTLLIATGVAALLLANPAFLGLIRYIGVMYLIYIGVRMMRRAAPSRTGGDHGKSDWRVFRQSFVANVLNPKVILFFVSLFPQFISNQEQAFVQTLVLGACFIAATMLVFGGVALLAGTLNDTLARKPRRQVLLQQLGGLALLLIAVWLGVSPLAVE